MGNVFLSESYYNSILLLKYPKLSGVSHANHLPTSTQHATNCQRPNKKPANRRKAGSAA